MQALNPFGNLLSVPLLRSATLLPLLIFCSAIISLAQTPGSNSTDPSSRRASRAATLRGRVVYDDTGLPVRHATITLINPESQEERPSTITDRRGEFVVKNLPPGNYIVNVDASDVIGFERLAMMETMEMMEMQKAPGANQAASLEKSRKENQRLTEQFLHKISFAGREDSSVELRVKRGGTISGKVSYADGSPAANLNVELFSKQGDGYVPVLVESIHAGFSLKPVQTDDLGRYRIIGLLPGEYFLSATESSANKADEILSSRDTQSLLITYYPSATDLKQAQAIRVELARETGDVDIILSERNLRSFAGTLKTRRGDIPVAKARIFLYRKDAVGKPAATGNFLHTESDEEGRWAFFEIPDGQYVIQFSPELGANEAWSFGDTSKQNFVELKRELTVAGDTPSELAIKVAAGGRLSGTVVVEGDQKFPGVHLSLRHVNGELLLNGQAFGTRPDFSFAVSGVVSEGLEINVITPMPGYQTKSISLNGAPLRQPLKVADGDDITGIKIVLAPVQ